RKSLPARSSNHPKPALATQRPVDEPRSPQSHVRYPYRSRFSSPQRSLQPTTHKTNPIRIPDHALNHTSQRCLRAVYTLSSQGSHSTFMRPTIVIPVAHI
ncbi:hypothetical protein COCCADRAFT_94557, partial [Bipolaris zeicola 26-R-13]